MSETPYDFKPIQCFDKPFKLELTVTTNEDRSDFEVSLVPETEFPTGLIILGSADLLTQVVVEGDEWIQEPPEAMDAFFRILLKVTNQVFADLETFDGMYQREQDVKKLLDNETTGNKEETP